MHDITVKLNISQPVRKLYTLDGHPVETIEDIENGAKLIGCVAGDATLKVPPSLSSSSHTTARLTPQPKSDNREE
jgi:hypothetical protein